MIDFKIKGSKIEILRGGKVDRVIQFTDISDLDNKLSILYNKFQIRYKQIISKEKDMGNLTNKIKSVIAKIKKPNVCKPDSKPK